MYHRVDAVGRQCPVGQKGQTVNGIGHDVGQERTHHVEGQEEHQSHNCDKQRNGKNTVGQHLVDLHTAPVLPAFLRLHHALAADLFDEIIAHVRQRGISVQPGLMLHLDDGVLDQFFFVLTQLQRVEKVLLALDELHGAEAAGDVDALGMILDDVAHRMDAPMHRPLGAEILHLGRHPAGGGVDKRIHQLGDALIFRRGNGNHRNTEGFRHLLHVHTAAVAHQLVHHVQGDHRRHLKRQELKRQIEVPLYVGGVHNVDNGVRSGFEDEIPGNDLLLRIGADGVNAGQVHHLMVSSLDYARLLIHRNTGEIAHMLIGAGKSVKQGGFAAVLVSRQCENHTVPSFSAIFRASSRRMVNS